ncbi:hypothetical protein D3C84_887290 [compost metagenome]
MPGSVRDPQKPNCHLTPQTLKLCGLSRSAISWSILQVIMVTITLAVGAYPASYYHHASSHRSRVTVAAQPGGIERPSFRAAFTETVSREHKGHAGKPNFQPGRNQPSDFGQRLQSHPRCSAAVGLCRQLVSGNHCAGRHY